MARMTVEVAQVRNAANVMLAAEGDKDPATGQAVRRGIALLAEKVLMDTGNYRGFAYLPSEFTEDFKGLRDGYDDTRRRYL